MAKNIAVFSDGTGQDGGARPEQRMSNVYKLYRVCRPGPDSAIDPSEQIAFYDPGLGTEEGATALTAPIRFFQKMLGSMTGRGVTTNIADCYEFIINHYEEGDRIFLIGFSRGAYTVRAVADLIRLCGIPTHADGEPLLRFRKATRDIAEEAVTSVLEHGAGHPRAKFEDEREELARRFRKKYGSAHSSGEPLRSNAAPYFIGVFDTVAALGAKGLRQWLIKLGLLLSVAVIALPISAILGGFLASLTRLSFWGAFGWIFLATLITGVGTLAYHSRKAIRKTIRDYPKKGDVHHHMAEWKGDNFPRLLSRFVSFARSANAIDETRADFARLPWGPGNHVTIDEEIDGHKRFEQLWFAGNHSDVGGSYPEQESRLSDIALGWMIEQATAIPEGLKVDGQKEPGVSTDIPKLRLFPSADGLQHCEIVGMQDTLAGLPRPLSRWFRNKGWAVQVRPIDQKAPVHPTVRTRFNLASVPNCTGDGAYRPQALIGHEEFKRYYQSDDDLSA